MPGTAGDAKFDVMAMAWAQLSRSWKNGEWHFAGTVIIVPVPKQMQRHRVPKCRFHRQF